MNSTGQCLDLTNGVLTNSNQVQIWKCTDHNTNQIWTLWAFPPLSRPCVRTDQQLQVMQRSEGNVTCGPGFDLTDIPKNTEYKLVLCNSR